MWNTESRQRRKFEKTLLGIQSSKVKLKGCGLDSEDATKLTEALRKNGAVTELHLWNNRIGPKGAGEIAKALMGHNNATSTLQVLDLGGNGIGDEGAIYLALALEQNDTLQELLLQDNGIGDAGAKALARALRTNKTLRTLYLHVNSIGAEGMCELIRALKGNKSLKTLEAYGNNAPVDLENQVLDEGGSALAKGG
jgi:Ran GTPase-activating protein (RanGAP) involved in mRNA processing and transport